MGLIAGDHFEAYSAGTHPAGLNPHLAAARTHAKQWAYSMDMVDVPQDFLLQAYELLRPGRAKSKQDLLDAAKTFRETHKAERVAAFLEEAAEVYERRGLFQFRY